MPTNIEILTDYFSVPYNGHIFIFTNPVTLNNIQQQTFTEMLSHKNAIDAQGQPGHSVAMSIFESITKHMGGLEAKKILDVGGNTGYFSFLATEAGADVTMIEKNSRQATVAKAIAKTKKINIEIIDDSIQKYLNSNSNKKVFNCTFMLNMFDQMLRTDEESAWETLMQISERSKILFLMMGPTEQVPTAKGLPTSTPSNILPAKHRFEKPDYEVIIEKTVYKNYKILATNIYENRQLQMYW